MRRQAMKSFWEKLTRYEVVERVVFFVAIIVLLLDVFIWRP